MDQINLLVRFEDLFYACINSLLYGPADKLWIVRDEDTTQVLECHLAHFDYRLLQKLSSDFNYFPAHNHLYFIVEVYCETLKGHQ